MSKNEILPPQGSYRKRVYDKLPGIPMAPQEAPPNVDSNPDSLPKASTELSTYDHVKQLALEFFHHKLREDLNLLISLNQCKDNEFLELEKQSHNVFSWLPEEFLKRRQLKNCIWIDVMTRKNSKECLENFKIHKDLQEVQQFVDRMLNGMKNEVWDYETSVWKPLRDIKHYWHILEYLQTEQLELQNTLKELQERLATENVVGHLDKQRSHLMVLEEMHLNSDIWDPIEIRYELNWYRSIFAQNQLKLDLVHQGREREISNLKMKLITEKDCGGSIMDAYYAEVELYKHRINEFQERYDYEFDKYDNWNTYIQAQIDKLHDTKKLLNQEIQKFHEEIQQLLEKEERQHLEKEIKRQEKEAAALLQSKQQKKRKKHKDKGGPQRKVVKRK